MADFDSFTYTGAARKWDTDLDDVLEAVTANNRIITDGKGTLIHGAYRSSWVQNDDLDDSGPAIAVELTETGGQADPAGGTDAWLFEKLDTTSGRALYRRHSHATSRLSFIVGIKGDGVSDAVSIGISNDDSNPTFYASNVRKIPFLGGAVGDGTLDGTTGRVKVTGLSSSAWTFFMVTTDAAIAAATSRFYVYPGGHDNTTIGEGCYVYRPTLSEARQLIGIDEIGLSGVDVPASLETRTLGSMPRTLYVDFYTPIADKASNADFVIASLDPGAGSDNNVLLTLSSDLDEIRVRPTVGGVASSTIALTSLSLGSDTRVKAAFSIAATGELNLAVNGAAAAQVPSTSPSGCVRCNLGSDPVGGGALWGHVREAQGWSNARTSGELVTLTA